MKGEGFRVKAVGAGAEGWRACHESEREGEGVGERVRECALLAPTWYRPRRRLYFIRSWLEIMPALRSGDVLAAGISHVDAHCLK